MCTNFNGSQKEGVTFLICLRKRGFPQKKGGSNPGGNYKYSRQLPRKKDYVNIQKGVHKQKRLVLCNLHELFVAFKERNPDVKIGFFKFCTLSPKWCVIAGSSGTHSVCVCINHQNTILLVDALNWEVTYKDFVNKVV